MKELTEEQINKINEQIDAQKKSVSYNVREFTIEIYVNKYSKDIEKDDNELYIPEYQREFVWDSKHQSRFIESLILGLPVPFFFAAEIKDTGRLEIVDGSQRIRTMAAFINDELELSNLRNLTELNDKKFSQLPSSRQRMFKNMPLRMVVLSADASEDTRKEMFDRINTSSVPLLPMETRRGIYRGKFMDFITKLADSKNFKKLCPLPKYMLERREEEELILRFFAFTDCYPDYKKVEDMGVAKYLDNYLNTKNGSIKDEEITEKEKSFNLVIEYICNLYPNQGFAKKKDVLGVSRPYFEAISVGLGLALKEKPALSVLKQPQELIVDKKKHNEFYNAIEGRYRTHTAAKIKLRIEIAKKAFINNDNRKR